MVEFDRFSSLQRLVHSIAYCLRFSFNAKSKPKNISHFKPEELNASLRAIIRVAQQEGIEQEIKKLKANQNLPRNNTILSLTPFLDGNNLLRVGGRITNFDLSFEENIRL